MFSRRFKTPTVPKGSLPLPSVCLSVSIFIRHVISESAAPSHHFLEHVKKTRSNQTNFYVTFFRCININQHLSFRLLLPSAEGHFISLVKCFKYILHCPYGAGAAGVLFMALVFTLRGLSQNEDVKSNFIVCLKTWICRIIRIAFHQFFLSN